MANKTAWLAIIWARIAPPSLFPAQNPPVFHLSPLTGAAGQSGGDCDGMVRMINANVIKGVHELLEQSGIRAEPDETLGDRVARALGISGRQSEILLESLHDGASLDEAVAAAEIDPSHLQGDLLVRIARAIGTALGRAAR
jgi:hypothetical protein